jgi:hypothetical protein
MDDLLKKATDLVVGLQEHNGKSICVMERLALVMAIQGTERRQAACDHKDSDLGFRYASPYCPKCGMPILDDHDRG